MLSTFGPRVRPVRVEKMTKCACYSRLVLPALAFPADRSYCISKRLATPDWGLRRFDPHVRIYTYTVKESHRVSPRLYVLILCMRIVRLAYDRKENVFLISQDKYTTQLPAPLCQVTLRRILPRRSQLLSSEDNGYKVDPRAWHAGSSVALVTQSLRSGGTQEQYRNKQKHWKEWCEQQRFLTRCFPLHFTPTLLSR